MRIYDYLDEILRALNAEESNGVPTPSWRIEEYLKDIYDAIRSGIYPGDEQVAEAIDAWLDDHPEATTTVEDGAITNAKLASSFVTPGTAAAYSSSATYAVGDYVFHNGSLYRCTTAITTAEAWTAGHWTAVALGDDVADLKSATDEIENRFTVATIKSQNLLDPSQIETGAYYWTDGRHASGSYNSTPYIPVTAGQTIRFQYGLQNAASRQAGGMRFVTGYNAEKQYVQNSAAVSAASYVVPEGVEFVIISAGSNILTESQLPVILVQAESEVLDYIPYFEPYDVHELKEMWLPKHRQNGVSQKFNISSDNAVLYADIQDMFDYSIQFRGTVGTFNGLIIAHGYNIAYGGYVKITPTKFEYYVGTEAEPRLSEDHNLTITDYIAVRIDAKANVNADFFVYTNGGSYSKLNQAWDVRLGYLQVRSVGTNTLTDCELSYYCKRWGKPIHMYGDSYFGVYSDKWTQYLTNAGMNNNLQNAYPGRTSATALKSLKTVIANSNPEKIIWCLGMNDGDDDGVVDASWKACVEELMQICTNRNIELILATIPNVATVDNSLKNAYVKSSGYRYIDFASAVGASSGTTWYTGMLSNDGVHPSTEGAIALFNQAIADVPELMQ